MRTDDSQDPRTQRLRQDKPRLRYLSQFSVCPFLCPLTHRTRMNTSVASGFES